MSRQTVKFEFIVNVTPSERADIRTLITGALARHEFSELAMTAISEIPEPLALTPIPMRLPCPECSTLHLDEGNFATKWHHTHACQYCGHVWRPAVVATVGVRLLPGFRNPDPTPPIPGESDPWTRPTIGNVSARPAIGDADARPVGVMLANVSALIRGVDESIARARSALNAIQQELGNAIRKNDEREPGGGT